MRSEDAAVCGFALGVVAVFAWLLNPPKPKVEQTKQIPPPHEDLDEYVGFDSQWWLSQMGEGQA